MTIASINHGPVAHGSPADRGSADAYYHKMPDPHWWPNGYNFGHRIEAVDMTAAEIQLYNDAHADEHDRKEYG